MATVQLNQQKLGLPDHHKIREVCEELGVPFGCRSGFCGTCKIEIILGEQNLNELNREELDMGNRDTKHRLACQAVIKQGLVIVKPEEK